jgi:hypothetical protein
MLLLQASRTHPVEQRGYGKLFHLTECGETWDSVSSIGIAVNLIAAGIAANSIAAGIAVN